MKEISVGDWIVVREHYGVTVGEVAYIDELVVLLKRTTGAATMVGIRDLVFFAGERKKVIALETRIRAMDSRKGKEIKDQTDKILKGFNRDIDALLSKHLVKKQAVRKKAK